MDENVDQKPLIIKEILQARELLKELQDHLNPSSFTGQDLINKILCSVENFLSILNRVKIENESTPESPLSQVSTGSPLSQCNSGLFPGGSRKRYRKAAVRWTEQVRVSSTQTGIEGPIDDGYDWRKYGQKDILGAKYPRAYYKCSYGNTQGCLAMKQVQRSELDLSIFDVTYIGKHSCIETSELLSREYKQEHDQRRRPNYHQEQREDKSFEETFINFQTSSVEVAKDKDKQLESFPSFSIYSTASPLPNFIGNCSETKQNLFYPYSVKPENPSPSPSPTPTCISTPAASESNYNVEGYNIGEDLLQTTADSHDAKDQMIISSPTFSATLPTNLMDSSWDWDFPIDYSPHF